MKFFILAFVFFSSNSFAADVSISSYMSPNLGLVRVYNLTNSNLSPSTMFQLEIESAAEKKENLEGTPSSYPWSHDKALASDSCSFSEYSYRNDSPLFRNSPLRSGTMFSWLSDTLNVKRWINHKDRGDQLQFALEVINNGGYPFNNKGRTVYVSCDVDFDELPIDDMARVIEKYLSPHFSIRK